MDKELTSMKVDPDFISQVDLTLFHADDYVDCLRQISIDQKERYAD